MSDGMKTQKHVTDFLIEISDVCKKHGLSISHEDCHGNFIIEEFKEENLEWLGNPVLRIPTKENIEWLPKPLFK